MPRAQMLPSWRARRARRGKSRHSAAGTRDDQHIAGACSRAQVQREARSIAQRRKEV